MRRLALPLLLGVAACGTNFAPVSEIDGFRVLGLRATPPDLHPGDTAVLDSLIVDPTDPSVPTSVLYLACDPDPTGLGDNVCSQYETAADAQSLFFPDGGLPAGVHFLGVGTGVYDAPADLFDGLPADAITRQAGVLAVVLAVAVGTTIPALPTAAEANQLLEQVVNQQIPSQLVIKRIRVSEDPDLDVNPVLGVVSTDTDVIRPEHPLLVLPGQTVPLLALSATGDDESYVSIGPDGTQDSRTSQVEVSWFTSAGSFFEDRTLDTDADQTLTAPDGNGDGFDHTIPSNRSFTLWVVIRDGRGGQDWQALPGLICDSTLPAIHLDAASANLGTLQVTGENLDQLVDISLDGQPVTGSFVAAQGAFVGRLPQGAQGNHIVEGRGRDCTRSQTSLAVP